MLFYVFGALAVVASLMVIGQRNAMYSVLLLIASFGALSGLYVLLEAPFVAVIQIIVYAGAIMVLFLFVVMLLDVGREQPDAVPFGGVRRLGMVLAGGLLLELVWALGRTTAAPGRPGLPALVSVKTIGVVLFTDYGFAFEVTAVLTLVAMLGAVVLTRKG